jgi:hypothetical protein
MNLQERRQILESIRASNGGRLTASLVVRAATDPKHPFHKQLLWDNEACGHRYRLIQARKIIKSVQVDIKIENRIVSTIRYVRDPDVPTNQQGYISLSEVQRRSQQAQDVLMLYLDRIEHLIRSAREVADAIGLGEDLQQLLLQTVLVKRKTKPPRDEAA